MKKSIFLFVFVCFCLGNVTAQVSEGVKEKKNTITFAPLDVFNVFNPAVQIGYQRDLSNNFILQIEAGIILKHSVFGFANMHFYEGQDLYSYSGYRLQAELKKIFFEKGNRGKSRFYYGCELSYLRNRGNVNNNYYDSSGEIYEDFFIHDKQRYRISAKLGYHLTVRGNFVIDLSTGLGLAYLNVKHYGRESPGDQYVSLLYGFILKPGKFFRINMPVSVKLGFKF